MIDTTFLLTQNRIETFGGNYDFYYNIKEKELKNIEIKKREKERALRNADKLAKKTIEKKEKLASRDKKKKLKEGTSKIIMNKLKENSENSLSKIKNIQADRISNLNKEIFEIKNKIPLIRSLGIKLKDSKIHKNKILIEAEAINLTYNEKNLWKENLSFTIISKDRIRIEGKNGSGKTSLLNIITKKLKPNIGKISISNFSYIYLEQEYMGLTNTLSISEQVQTFNKHNTSESEINQKLHQFLFSKESWNKKIHQLSGGEKIRLLFCCLLLQNATPDIIILDEPTNNLDIETIEIITSSIKNFEGALLVISHDEYFIKEIGIEKSIKI